MNKKSFVDAVVFALIVVGILWVIHLVEYFMDLRFFTFGVLPRNLGGLKGVFLAPFIHGDSDKLFSGHLISNSFPSIVLLTILFFYYRSIAAQVLCILWIGTGLVVWTLARPTYHIGASGVVYGLVAFVFWMGMFRKEVGSIALSLLILFLYSGLFMGILPTMEGVSWESHLYGALVGIITAFVFKKEEDSSKDEEEGDDGDYFFERDVFEEKKDNESQTGTGNIGWNSTIS